ncbi:hypothetical protein [Dermabacter sp. HMSC08H10]|uniref:hypothetical protein n=1 Tax=Dermabacter sp. HMSC08H10 TaxID=1581144 RepID=UPI00114CF0B2|nr:hypothetical protein [Dermabacter sp. HMSC08H10]
MANKIHAGHALMTAFLAKFPGADAEALSYLLVTEANNFGVQEGQLISNRTAERKLQSLRQLGAIQAYKHRITARQQFGATDFGHELATMYDYDIQNWRKLNGISISRLEHYRAIALTAARLISPVQNELREKLGLAQPLPLERVISEYEISSAYTAKDKLAKRLKMEGKDGATFPEYRAKRYVKLDRECRDGKRERHTLSRDFPELWTIAFPDAKARDVKFVQVPDLAIRRDDAQLRNETSPKGKNIAIEVELSPKRHEEYVKILKTYAEEFQYGTAYERVLYVVGNKQVERALKTADEKIGLEASGRLILHRLLDKQGNTVNTHKKVVVKAAKEAAPTVQEVSEQQHSKETRRSTTTRKATQYDEEGADYFDIIDRQMAETNRARNTRN